MRRDRRHQGRLFCVLISHSLSLTLPLSTQSFPVARKSTYLHMDMTYNESSDYCTMYMKGAPENRCNIFWK